jgi:uncharacterized surface protein with fasciclin (FAS1) repeats
LNEENDMGKFVTVTVLLLVIASLALPAFAQVNPTPTTQTTPQSGADAAATVTPQVRATVPQATSDSMTDGTMMPNLQGPTTADYISGNFVRLTEALQAAGLMDTLASGEYTVFVPNDGAFITLLNNLDLSLNDLLANQSLLQGVLTYHVVPGIYTADDIRNGAMGALETVQGSAITFGFDTPNSRVTLNNGAASIEQADIRTGNGIVHVIDNVLLPPNATELMMNPMLMAEATAEVGVGNTIENISENTFVVLTEAVAAAGLTDELMSGEYTLFAPNDGAFLTFLNDQGISYSQLLADQTLLESVLTYHLVPGTITVEDIQGGQNALQTVNGATLNFGFDTPNSRVTINNGAASVEQSDIFASNGVVHIIDNVLLPPQ